MFPPQPSQVLPVVQLPSFHQEAHLTLVSLFQTGVPQAELTVNAVGETLEQLKQTQQNVKTNQ